MSQTKRSRKPRGLSPVHPAAAAIDIGATMHVAAVGPDRDKEPVRTFRTFTGDLERLADWFARCGIKTIAMESTGVYWVPVFEILEQRGFEVMVVNARDAKHVPGARPTSAMRNGSNDFTNTAYCAPVFAPRPRSRGCVPICGSGNDCWITQQRISSTCKRR